MAGSIGGESAVLFCAYRVRVAIPPATAPNPLNHSRRFNMAAPRSTMYLIFTRYQHPISTLGPADSEIVFPNPDLPMMTQAPVQASATMAPEVSAVIQPKCFTRMGTSEVETIPPRMPAVFITPDAAPALSPEICTAVAQKADSAKYSPPMLRESAATVIVRLPASAAVKSKTPDTP